MLDYETLKYAPTDASMNTKILSTRLSLKILKTNVAALNTQIIALVWIVLNFYADKGHFHHSLDIKMSFPRTPYLVPEFEVNMSTEYMYEVPCQTSPFGCKAWSSISSMVIFYREICIINLCKITETVESFPVWFYEDTGWC